MYYRTGEDVHHVL